MKISVCLSVIFLFSLNLNCAYQKADQEVYLNDVRVSVLVEQLVEPEEDGYSEQGEREFNSDMRALVKARSRKIVHDAKKKTRGVVKKTR